ncbi:hypothetical protein HCUR_01172 [Holospora curviuscula]|uniref:Uncharacterized protein n=1 Tax=Holospora curviuscula TaxID=1082868 RepID=A0A2S5R7S8_9PROT|nr:hypothetical protein HCUR_01172 [Holospora curviuscula]
MQKFFELLPYDKTRIFLSIPSFKMFMDARPYIHIIFRHLTKERVQDKVQR